MPNKKTNQNIEKIDNKCFECAYCARHYINFNGVFRPANCMHCTNGKIPVHASKKRIANIEKCELWQPKKMQIEQRRESIEIYLRQTAGKLNEIAQILKEDKNK